MLQKFLPSFVVPVSVTYSKVKLELCIAQSAAVSGNTVTLLLTLPPALPVNMADFLQQLDPSKLVMVGAVSCLTILALHLADVCTQALSLVTSAFTAPSYNLPIFLFGTYASEAADATQSLQTVILSVSFNGLIADLDRQFVAITGASMVLDIIFLARHHQNWFIKLITIVILLLKVRFWSDPSSRTSLRVAASHVPGLWTGPSSKRPWPGWPRH